MAKSDDEEVDENGCLVYFLIIVFLAAWMLLFQAAISLVDKYILNL